MACGHFDEYDESLWPADANGVVHEDKHCIVVLQAEVAKLQATVRSWKNAWFVQREATGQAAWAAVPDYPRGPQ